MASIDVFGGGVLFPSLLRCLGKGIGCGAIPMPTPIAPCLKGGASATLKENGPVSFAEEQLWAAE